MDQKLKSIVDTLWRNWAFRLSLSSNELFHSNIIQFLAESPHSPPVQKGEEEARGDMEVDTGKDLNQPDNFSATEPSDASQPTFIDIVSARRFMHIFCDDAALGECEKLLQALRQDSLLQVAREKGDMDLTVLIPTEEANGKQRYKPLFALEVKVKAYPDAEQLARYRTYLNAKWTTDQQGNQIPEYRPPLVLLTGMGLDYLKEKKIVRGLTDSKTSQIDGDEPTYGMNFSELEGRLRNSGLAVGPIGTEYLALCSALQQLFTALELHLKDSVSFKDAQQLAKELEPYRLHALWWKLWAADHARACSTAFGTAAGVETHSDFTHTGNFGVFRKWPGPEISKPKKALSIGLQVEGNSLRFFLHVVHPDLGARHNARLNVEQCLLRLIQDDGIFACVPGIDQLVTSWHTAGITNFRNHKIWQSEQPALPIQSGENGWPELAKLFKGRLGQTNMTGDHRPMLTGYANGQGDGFADLRVKLNDEYTRENVVALARGIFIENAFSRVEKGSPPLLEKVVDAFAEAPENWLESYLPGLRT